MKVCVYAICKNEEQFVERWVQSMQEADAIYVLDTGSTDGSVQKLKALGVHVQKKIIRPWRFDVARNESLKLLPSDTDICVCTDLDEVFLPGWRKTLEEVWQEHTTRLRYNYNWSFDDLGNPAVNFYIEKIHALSGYRWTHPVHEILSYDRGEEVIVTTDRITVNHYPDSTKSRGSYLPLLELSVKEDPDDDRSRHYLGREYMFYGKWNEAIDTLIGHLHLPRATWKDERCASMRFIARCYKELKRYDEAKMWLDKAIKEAPYLRDPYVERALLDYHLEDWASVEEYCLKALEIKNHAKTYINEPFSWNETIYDLLSLSCFYQGKIDESLKYVDMAIAINPKDERLKENRALILQKKEVSDH